MNLKKILFNLKRNNKVNLEYSNNSNLPITTISLIYKTPILELFQSITNTDQNRNDSIIEYKETELEFNLEKNKTKSYTLNSNLDKYIKDLSNNTLRNSVFIFEIKSNTKKELESIFTLPVILLLNSYSIKLQYSGYNYTKLIVYGDYVSFKKLSEEYEKGSTISDENHQIVYDIIQNFENNIDPRYYTINEIKFDDILEHMIDISSYKIYIIDSYNDKINTISFITNEEEIVQDIRESNYNSYITYHKNYYLITISQKDMYSIIQKVYTKYDTFSQEIPDNVILLSILDHISSAIKNGAFNVDKILEEDDDNYEENNSQYYKDIDEIIE